jgi:hypothetical protein
MCPRGSARQGADAEAAGEAKGMGAGLGPHAARAYSTAMPVGVMYTVRVRINPSSPDHLIQNVRSGLQPRPYVLLRIAVDRI